MSFENLNSAEKTSAKEQLLVKMEKKNEEIGNLKNDTRFPEVVKERLLQQFQTELAEIDKEYLSILEGEKAEEDAADTLERAFQRGL